VSHEDGEEGQGEEEDTGFSSDELVLLRNIFSSHEGGSGAGGSGLVGAEQVGRIVCVLCVCVRVCMFFLQDGLLLSVCACLYLYVP
jgi:hypothetical protein